MFAANILLLNYDQISLFFAQFVLYSQTKPARQAMEAGVREEMPRLSPDLG